MAEKLDRLLAQKKSLEARIAKEKVKSKQQERKDETRRKILVGAIVLNHMQHDTNFKQSIEALLDTQLTKTIDRKLLGLTDKETISASSVKPQKDIHTAPVTNNSDNATPNQETYFDNVKDK